MSSRRVEHLQRRRRTAWYASHRSFRVRRAASTRGPGYPPTPPGQLKNARGRRAKESLPATAASPSKRVAALRNPAARLLFSRSFSTPSFRYSYLLVIYNPFTYFITITRLRLMCKIYVPTLQQTILLLILFKDYFCFFSFTRLFI
jgi:hypothetical protein